MLSRQSHRYMLKHLIELNDKKMAGTVASTVRKGISIINLWFEISRRDCSAHSFIKAIDIETNEEKNVRLYNNNYFINISLISDNIYTYIENCN